MTLGPFRCGFLNFSNTSGGKSSQPPHGTE